MRIVLATFLVVLLLSCLVSADLVGDLGQALVDIVYTGIYNAVYDLLSELMDLVLSLLIWNPPLEWAYDAWNTIRILITSMYLAVITFAGLKLMTGTLAGGNERSTLKRWLGGSIISLLLVNMSFALYEFILEFNVALSALMFQEPELSGFLAASAAFLILLILFTTIVLLVIILLLIRITIVLWGVVLFPIGIFLYYFPPTKRFGKLLNTLLLANIFLQFFEVVCLSIAMDAFSAMGESFTGTVFNAVFGISMMMLMLAVPLITYGFATIAGMILHKTTEVVTNVVPIPVGSFKIRGKK